MELFECVKAPHNYEEYVGSKWYVNKEDRMQMSAINAVLGNHISTSPDWKFNGIDTWEYNSSCSGLWVFMNNEIATASPEIDVRKLQQTFDDIMS